MKIGKFIIKNFQDQEIEIFTGMESEYINYADTNTFNRFILRGVVVAYDEECGVITLKDHDGHIFYINEFKVEIFYKAGSGFELLKSLKSMIRTGKDFSKKDRDFM